MPSCSSSDASPLEENKEEGEDSEMTHEPADFGLHQLIMQSSDPEHLTVETKYGRTSNGYLEYIFRRAAHEVFKVEIQED